MTNRDRILAILSVKYFKNILRNVSNVEESDSTQNVIHCFDGSDMNLDHKSVATGWCSDKASATNTD